MNTRKHVSYPHTPGFLYDCPACESRCHCTGDAALTNCIARRHVNANQPVDAAIALVKYAGGYSGPSYGGVDYRDGLAGFTSISAAVDYFRERQQTSGAWPLASTDLTVNADNEITYVKDTRGCWPSTSTQDTLELYAVTDGTVADYPFMRLSAGPRGGVVRENY